VKTYSRKNEPKLRNNETKRNFLSSFLFPFVISPQATLLKFHFSRMY